MGPTIKKLMLCRCTGCCFFSYIAFNLLFIQDPLCQIRLVIKIKSTGKSAESWRAFEKGLVVQSLQLCKQLLWFFVLFLLPLKGKVWKIRGFIKRISVQREHFWNHFLLKQGELPTTQNALCMVTVHASGVHYTKIMFSDVKDLLCPQAGLAIYRPYFPGLLSEPFRVS